jgi:hypothetical protein
MLWSCSPYQMLSLSLPTLTASAMDSELFAAHQTLCAFAHAVPSAQPLLPAWLWGTHLLTIGASA